MPDSEILIAQIRELGFKAAPRRFAYGLVATDDNSSGVQLRGIDLVYEQTVTEIHQHVMTGQWLDSDDTYGVVIGKKLARMLDADVGSELVYIGQAADGSMANEIFKVRGILKTVSATIDNSTVLMSDQTLIELLILPEGAHEIVVMRSDREKDLNVAREQIANLSPEYETVDWTTLLPVIARFLETADVQVFVMMLFTYIAVATVVVNAILMSVFERIHEFGIMKAIGVTPLQSVVLIYLETMMQTIIACLIGLVFGWWASDYYQTHGLDMSEISGDFSFAGIALDPIWYAHVTVDVLMSPVIFLIVIAALSAVYPAVKVAMIKAVDAIHYQ